jgi:nitrate reductase beta subunit
MAYVITRLCRDCLDTACVAVCPVDCIYRYVGEDQRELPEPALHPPG